MQNQFNAGEISPRMFGRTDLPIYGQGVKTLLNFIVMPEGGVIRRSGTRFVVNAREILKVSRLIPFVFSTVQAYVLEFADLKIRVFRNEALVLAPTHIVPSSAINTLLDEWTVPDEHGYVHGQGPFRLTTSDTIPTGLTAVTQDYFIFLQRTSTFFNGDIDLGTERITITTHNYRGGLGDVRQGPFRLSSTGALPSGGTTGWNSDTDVFVERVDANTIELYDLVLGGTIQDVSTIHGTTFVDGDVTVAEDIITIANHGFADQFGPVQLTESATLPAGLATGTDYFITVVDKDTIQFSLSAGGAAVDITAAAGGGTHTIGGQHSLTPTPTYLRQKFRLSTTVNGTPVGLATSGVGFQTIASESGTLPLEIDATYLESELSAIHFAQSADVLYITHPDHPVRKLSRTSDTTWSLLDVDFTDGPFNDIGIGELTAGTTITAAGLSPDAAVTAGNRVTLTADNAMWRQTDIDRLVRGQVGTTWGYAQITGFVSNAVVHAIVKEDFNGAAFTTQWRLGSWGSGPTEGFPRSVSFFEQRLSFSSNIGGPQTFYSSVSASFENFEPTDSAGVVEDDDGLNYTISSNQINDIRWVASIRSLILGTSSSMWTLQATSFLDPITPTNVQIKRSSIFGTSVVTPAVVEDLIIYATNSNKQVRALGYKFESDSYVSRNLMKFSEHLLVSPALFISYAQEPHSIIWIARTDGQLLGLTFNQEEQVMGWARHIISGSFGDGDAVVESIAVIPSPTEDHHQLWLSIKRTINSATLRHIEFMEEPFEDGDTLSNAFFVDSGVTRDDPVTITGITAADPVVITTATSHGWFNDRQVKIELVGGMTELNGNSYFMTSKTANTLALCLINKNNSFVDGDVDVANDQITLAAHGFSADDKVRLMRTSGTFPVPLVATTTYFVQVIDINTVTLALTSGGAAVDITSAAGGGAYRVALTLDGTAFTAYTSGGEVRDKVTAISGLTHLEGESVSVLGDGATQANKTVSSGAITIDTAAAVVHTGLGYNSDIETLRLEPSAGRSGLGSKASDAKRITDLVIRLDNTVGLLVGPDSSNLDNVPFEVTAMNSPPDLFTGDKTVELDSAYDNDAIVFLRQPDPLPMTVIALIPHLWAGDR